LRALFFAPRPYRARPTRAWMRIASLRSMCISSSSLRHDVGADSSAVNAMREAVVPLWKTPPALSDRPRPGAPAPGR
jgi:hypothetical protein